MTTVPHPFGGRRFNGVDGFEGVSTQLGLLARFIRENNQKFKANAGLGAVGRLNEKMEEFANELRAMALPEK